jgi:hypothetical protein
MAYEIDDDNGLLVVTNDRAVYEAEGFPRGEKEEEDKEEVESGALVLHLSRLREVFDASSDVLPRLRRIEVDLEERGCKPAGAESDLPTSHSSRFVAVKQANDVVGWWLYKRLFKPTRDPGEDVDDRDLTHYPRGRTPSDVVELPPDFVEFYQLAWSRLAD